jgi:hypothetical protein
MSSTDRNRRIVGLCTVLALLALAAPFIPGASAHGVSEQDKGLIGQGLQLGRFVYLGRETHGHRVRPPAVPLRCDLLSLPAREVGLYVTLFALGHSVTLLYGVLSGTNANAHIVDAIIGGSVIYKGFDNLGGFRRLLGFQPDTKAAVLIFGLFHGLGLATKLQEFALLRDGLVANIVAFNVGVELGQIMGLGLVLIAMGFWRRSRFFGRHSMAANVVLMTCGFILVGYQLCGYYINGDMRS